MRTTDSAAGAGTAALCATTRAVRSFYEQYPYPDGEPVLRVGYDVRFVLSLGALERPGDRPIHVLDAGCGRGMGIIGEATVQPDVVFTGIDLNRTALSEVQQQVERRGLANVKLAEVDLMTLDGLVVPEGGFDVIRSSGVVHHLADPVAGLTRLGEVLAPHGVIDLMVYGTYGRAPIFRVARALRAMLADELPLAEKLARGRAFCAELADAGDARCPWSSACAAPDAEFVDRYLHPNERSYTLPELVGLAGEAGLRALEFKDPPAWSIERWIGGAAQRAALRKLAPMELLRAIEELSQPGKLEVYLARPENGRRDTTRTPIENATLVAHPDAAFSIATRHSAGATRIEEVRVRLRNGEFEPLPLGPLGLAGSILATQSEPFIGADLVEALVGRGVGRAEARGVLCEVEARELVYRPHPIDVRASAQRLPSVAEHAAR